MIGDKTMKDKNSISKILVIETLIFVGWCAAIFATLKTDLIGFNFWFAFAFGIITFVASFVSIVRIKISCNRNLTEINALPFVVTVIYFAASLALNSIFIFRLYFGFRMILVLGDFILLTAFAAYRLFTNNYSSHVENLTDKVEDKVADVRRISSVIAGIAGKTSDAERKKRILKLKETVDYSTNMTQSRLYEIQEEFLLELNKLETMIDEGCGADAFNDKMNRIESMWKSRNTTV